MAGRTDIAAVGVTGKPFIFAVGADLTGAALIRSRDQALAIGRLGHAVFRRFGELSVPSFAFVNGAALGGGLELALHCTYRTISSGVPAVAFPECFLGLVPGWGGTYLLPRLIGPAKALKVIVENPLSQNRMLRGPEAFSLGIADAMFEPADFLAESLRWAARVLSGDRSTVSGLAPDGGLGRGGRRGAVLRRRQAARRRPRPVPGHRPGRRGPGPTRDEGFAAEDEALADLLLSDELRAGLYAFDLTQKRARKRRRGPGQVAGPAGDQGRRGGRGPDGRADRAAVRAAARGAGRADRPGPGAARRRASATCTARSPSWPSRGRISADAAARLTGLVTGSLTKDAFADADFVIEAVFEEIAVKQQVFAEVEAVVRPDCVLATNTSSLSVTEMAAGLAHPERVVGFHFFNPVAMMPLVEVVRAAPTDDAALATALARRQGR